MVKNREAHAAPPSYEETNSHTSSESEGEDLPSTPPPSSVADKKPAAQKKRVGPAAEKERSCHSEPNVADSSLKSIASKPMEAAAKKKMSSNSESDDFVVSPSKMLTPAKRVPAVEEEDLKNSKMGKSEGERGVEEGKKLRLFQRIWSDEDEIVILKGILEYKEKKGADPMTNLTHFHDFIKKSLHVNVDPTQIRGKVRRLKDRYLNIVVGKKKTSSPHESNTFELSKEIWGNVKSTAASEAEKTNKVVMNRDMASSSSYQFIGKVGISMGMDEAIVKMGLRLCNRYKKAEIEEEWKQLHLEEMNLLSRKLDLAREESKLIIEALKSEGKY